MSYFEIVVRYIVYQYSSIIWTSELYGKRHIKPSHATFIWIDLYQEKYPLLLHKSTGGIHCALNSRIVPLCHLVVAFCCVAYIGNMELDFLTCVTYMAASSLMDQLLVHLHQLCDAGSFGGGLDVKAVCLHDGFVILLMCFAELRRHGDFIIKIGKAGIWVQSAGIKDGLCGLLNLGLLRIGRSWPREVVIDNILGIAVIAL